MSSEELFEEIKQNIDLDDPASVELGKEYFVDYGGDEEEFDDILDQDSYKKTFKTSYEKAIGKETNSVENFNNTILPVIGKMKTDLFLRSIGR